MYLPSLPQLSQSPMGLLAVSHHPARPCLWEQYSRRIKGRGGRVIRYYGSSAPYLNRSE
jgi:hypothetical protein